jgi:hypothetical protein
MRVIVWHLLLIGSLVGANLTARGEELVFCGWDEVFIADIAGSSNDTITKLWSWRAADRQDLPENFRTLFNSTDDCKPVDGGRRVLISSSGGGLAVVERPSGRVAWYGQVGNAHSIELLPGDRVVVAGSTNPEGNKLAVFDLKQPNTIIFQDSLHSGHGVVWDEERQLLWALGYDELRAYSLEDWTTSQPKLALEGTHSLPSESGHDLLMTPNGDGLLLTTNQEVLAFDIEAETFSPYPPLEGLKRVKGISIHPVTRRTAYIQAEGENWWSTRVRFLNPTGELLLEQEHLYKVRWVVP